MKTCLVVDDSDVIRKVARRLLERMSFTIQEAENGQQALEQCHREMPDAILLDWHMPVMSGVEFLEALRLVRGGKQPYILYCTTENDPGDITRAMAAGAHDYLLKPFDKSAIEAKLSEAGMLS